MNGRVRRYPRLRIQRGHRSVLVTVGPGHRGYEMRRYWLVSIVNGSASNVLYAGRDDSIFGWVDCVDYCQRTIEQARRMGAL